MTRRDSIPVFLRVEGRSCVVVGAGRLARPRIDDLLGAGADVTVVAPDAAERLGSLVEARRVRALQREYRPGDLEDAFLAVAATGAREVDRAVHREARERGCPITTVDTLPLCDWSSPSVMRRGDLTVAFSTAGRAPALAAGLRNRFEDELDDELGELLASARLWRRRIARCICSRAERRQAWYRLVDDDDAGGMLPPRLELPLELPEGGAPDELGRVGVVGTSLLHATVETVEALARSVDDLRHDLSSWSDGAMLRDTRVLVSRERVEVAYESDRPDEVSTLLQRVLAERAGMDVDAFRARSLSASGAVAVAHWVALAAGLRSVVVHDAGAFAAVDRAAGEGGGLLGSLLDACARAGREALDSVGASTGRESLPSLAARFLDDRLPHPERCRVSILGNDAGQCRAAVEARGLQLLSAEDPKAGSASEMVILLDEGGQGPSRDEVEALHDSGWKRAWILDTCMPRAVRTDVDELGFVTRWDLDALADVTVSSELPADRVANVAAELTEALSRILKMPT